MATGYLVRTGTGINDVTWKSKVTAGDRIFTSGKTWVTAEKGSTYTALYRSGGV